MYSFPLKPYDRFSGGDFTMGNQPPQNEKSVVAHAFSLR
jgi:hypothetical protein